MLPYTHLSPPQAKTNPFIGWKLFAARRIFPSDINEYEMPDTVKQFFPVFLALIPLIAVVGACVSVP